MAGTARLQCGVRSGFHALVVRLLRRVTPWVLFCACRWLVNWKVLEGSVERGQSPSTEHPRSALLSAAGPGSLSLPPSPQWHT